MCSNINNTFLIVCSQHGPALLGSAAHRSELGEDVRRSASETWTTAQFNLDKAEVVFSEFGVVLTAFLIFHIIV